MNAVALTSTAVCFILVSKTSGLTFFENHRYDHAPTGVSMPRAGFSGLQNQMLKERQANLMKFIVNHQEVESDDDYQPRDVIRPGDVVGVLPSGVFKMRHKESPEYRKPPVVRTTEKPADIETSESQNVYSYKNLWSGSQFTPERIANHRYADPHTTHGLYERPHGRVKVHTYRGPAKEYWVLPLHHKPEQKTYTPWGYYIKQPVGSEHDKFHSPLDLSFHYD